MKRRNTYSWLRPRWHLRGEINAEGLLLLSVGKSNSSDFHRSQRESPAFSHVLSIENFSQTMSRPTEHVASLLRYVIPFNSATRRANFHLRKRVLWRCGYCFWCPSSSISTKSLVAGGNFLRGQLCFHRRKYSNGPRI